MDDKTTRSTDGLVLQRNGNNWERLYGIKGVDVVPVTDNSRRHNHIQCVSKNAPPYCDDNFIKSQNSLTAEESVKLQRILGVVSNVIANLKTFQQ